MNVLPQLSHVGIYVNDLDHMTGFYTRVLNMAVTDTGIASTTKSRIAFLSASPDAHHQLALIQWPADRPHGPSSVNQLSFKVATLSELRALEERVRSADVAKLLPLNHGNALSIYTHDPEGNGIELYMDLPWYVSQPFGDPLDLTLSDDEIYELTERRVRSCDSFQERADWSSDLERRLNETIATP